MHAGCFSHERAIASALMLLLAAGCHVRPGAVTPVFESDEPEHHVPAWSPDGRRIAFVDDRGGQLDIHVAEADGSTVRRLTHDTVRERDLSWSPDGRLLAYTTDSPGTIHLLDADPGPDRASPRALRVPGDVPPRFVRWSPDGAALAFSARDLYVVAPDGRGDARRLVDLGRDRWSGRLDWAPDARRIVFEVFGRQPAGAGEWAGRHTSDLYVASLDGSDLTRLTDHPAPDLDPRWAPHAELVAFVSGRGGNADIYAVAPDGARLNRVTSYGSDEDSPRWSGDRKSRYIAYRYNGRDRDALSKIKPEDERFHVRLPQTAVRNLYHLEWSPAKQRLAFAAERDGRLEIYTMSATGILGAGVRQITGDPARRQDTRPIRVELPEEVPLRPVTAEVVFRTRYDSAEGTLGGEHNAHTGELLGPADMAVGPDGAVWILDDLNRRVVRFTREEGLAARFALPPEVFRGAIAVGPDGTIYVAPLNPPRLGLLVFGPDGRRRHPIEIPTRLSGLWFDLAVWPVDGGVPVITLGDGRALILRDGTLGTGEMFSAGTKLPGRPLQPYISAEQVAEAADRAARNAEGGGLAGRMVALPGMHLLVARGRLDGSTPSGAGEHGWLALAWPDGRVEQRFRLYSPGRPPVHLQPLGRTPDGRLICTLVRHRSDARDAARAERLILVLNPADGLGAAFVVPSDERTGHDSFAVAPDGAVWQLHLGEREASLIRWPIDPGPPAGGDAARRLPP